MSGKEYDKNIGGKVHLTEEEGGMVRKVVEGWFAERGGRSVRAEAPGPSLEGRAADEIKFSRRKLLVMVGTDEDILMCAILLVAAGAMGIKYICA